MFGIGSVTQRLGAAYASAFASTLLRDWKRADHAIEIAFKVLRQEGASDARAERAVRLLAVQSLIDRRDLDGAKSMLLPLRAEVTRPVLLLQAQLALALAERDVAIGTDGPARERGSVADLGREPSAGRAGVEGAERAVGDQRPGAARTARRCREPVLRSATCRARSSACAPASAWRAAASASDYIEASVIDARLRDITTEMRALMAEQKKGRGPGG